MDAEKLSPILDKEPILYTANARDLKDNPDDVLARYHTYALTHIPLGDTTKQLRELERVVVENKHCAVGTIVGPYGYGKTSTAVHLWHELRAKQVLAVPPFLWVNLAELMDAVYYWLCFEFSQGPKAFLAPLEKLYKSHQQGAKDAIIEKIGSEQAQEWIEQGVLNLSIQPADIVAFFSGATEICVDAGYKGLVVFTDELQQTLVEYKPSRDEFFGDLLRIIKDILALEGHWAWVISLDSDTEATISRTRNDILQRMQRSALYFRVRDVYDRREYPTELWKAYEERFDFDGRQVIDTHTLDSIGQLASREDLGAGPRMVTQVLKLAIQSYMKTEQPYTPLQFVDDFLAGQVMFDRQGRFTPVVKKALGNAQVKISEEYQAVVKLLAAYPLGCPEKTLEAFGYLDMFRAFPALARRDLTIQLSGGATLRSLAEENRATENIVQRLTAEFAGRFSPGKSYVKHVVDSFLTYVLEQQTFSGWKGEALKDVELNGVKYQVKLFRGNVDSAYPERAVAVLVGAVPGSPAPDWKKQIEQADVELRFELNYNLSPTEPSRLIVAPERSDVAIFQLNTMAAGPNDVKIIPNLFFEYYNADRWNPFLCLSLIEYLLKHQGEVLDDQNHVKAFLPQLRQFALLVLLGDQLETASPSFVSHMVGSERIKDLLKKQCQALYPHYKTLITNPKWQDNIQSYEIAVRTLIAQNELSIARGHRSYEASKEEVATVFAIPGKRLGNIEPLIENLKHLIVKEDFSGRTAASMVKLRFRLHPLEEDLLKQLEASEEKVQRNGVDVPRLPGGPLLVYAKREGYTQPEIKALLSLMKERRYVDMDSKLNLERRADNVDDLRDRIQEKLVKVELQTDQLAETLPDFEKSRYPLGALQTQLEQAQERDELEMINREVALQLEEPLRNFVHQRLHTYKERISTIRDDLHRRIRQGIPSWLSSKFDPSPLRDLLEKQREDLAVAYQDVLSEVRQLYEASALKEQGTPIRDVVSFYEKLQQLSKTSERLITRIKSFQDRQEDFDAWRKVSRAAAEVDEAAQSARDVYANEAFMLEAEQLWATLHARHSAQALSFLSSHRSVGKEIEKLRERVLDWLDRRRDDFEERCLTYQQLLANAHIKAELKIPFDRERPNESQMVLLTQVERYLDDYLEKLSEKLKASLEVIRYCIQVQGADLSSAEAQAMQTYEKAGCLRDQITLEMIGDPTHFKTLVLPLISLAEEQKKLDAEILQATKQRPAEDSELRLMEIFQTATAVDGIDLRGVIISLINREGTVNLSAVMHDLESLFQKNLIDIRVRLSRSERL